LSALHSILVLGTAGRLFLFGATCVAAVTIVQSWLMAGLARRTGSLDAATARTLYDVATYWGPTLTAFTLLTLGAVVYASFGEHTLPSWLGYVAVVAFAEQLVETMTIVSTSGFTAPGGPMNSILGAGLTLLVWLLTGIVAARQPVSAGGSVPA
jgi:hypothetical protein